MERPVVADVLVVGAGLAGLACAVELQRAGVDALVLEAGDHPGGRVRTDHVDGFTCDRGFQLLNPSYPAARALLDLEALDLRVFGRGIEVVGTGRGGAGDVAVLADPLAEREHALETAKAALGLVRPGQAARLARWAAPALGPVDRLLDAPDRTLGAALDAAGVDGPLRHAVLERFLTGTVADDPGQLSERMARLLLRSFLRATPGVPAAGMEAMPRQLAGLLTRLPLTGHRVTSVARAAGGLDVTVERQADAAGAGPGGDTWRAGAVVVAADPATASTLAGVEPVPLRGLSTWWFATPAQLPGATDMLRVDAAGGPVVNTSLVSRAAPSYAPPGRGLVQASTLHPGPGRAAPDEAAVRRHLDRLWGDDARAWEVVAHHDVPEALPASHPPLEHRKTVDLGDGLLVAGDHRDTSSIQGALVSGRRAARAAVASLAGRGA